MPPSWNAGRRTTRSPSAPLRSKGSRKKKTSSRHSTPCFTITHRDGRAVTIFPAYENTDFRGRCFSWGAKSNGLILIQPKKQTSAKDYLDTAVHETVHFVRPDLSEDQVADMANWVAAVLWRLGYRRK